MSSAFASECSSVVAARREMQEEEEEEEEEEENLFKDAAVRRRWRKVYSGANAVNEEEARHWEQT